MPGFASRIGTAVRNRRAATACASGSELIYGTECQNFLITIAGSRKR